MNNEALQKLKTLALAATPGNRFLIQENSPAGKQATILLDPDDVNTTVFESFWNVGDNSLNDLIFAAACSPDVILALIERIESLAAPAVANAAPVDCVERVARAICSACEENPDHQGDARGNAFRWQDYVVAARAALVAQAPQAALTDDQIHDIMSEHVDCSLPQGLAFARAILSAAAPNAGLVEALQNIASACNCCGDRADLAEIAADALANAGIKVAL